VLEEAMRIGAYLLAIGCELVALVVVFVLGFVWGWWSSNPRPGGGMGGDNGEQRC
jgi:hypothetical protein